MGLKLRLGLAGLGLALSSMFGVNMLSGVKDYVDTTGNIMVDIADGIGMVSKVKGAKNGKNNEIVTTCRE